MKWIARTLGLGAIALLAGMLLLASCSRPSGRVTIGIVYQGGPAPGNSSLLRPGTIRIVRASDGSLVATSHVADGTTFEADLRPDNYRVDGTSGDARCLERAVNVAAGSSRQLLIECSVR